MGEFYKDKKEEAKDKKEEAEYIEDSGTLLSTYDFENEKYQHTKDRDYDSILPIRHRLLGSSDIKDTGKLNELKKHLKVSKLMEMTIGQRMLSMVGDIEELANKDEIHMELLEEHVKHYQFLCESALKIIDNLYGDIKELNSKVGEKEQHITDLTTEPEEIIIPPSEERKKELEGIYESLRSSFEFANLVNPRRGGKDFTPGERAYLKEYNQRIQKFKGTRGKEQIKEKVQNKTVEPAMITKEQSESPTFSHLQQKPQNPEPLKDKEIKQ